MSSIIVKGMKMPTSCIECPCVINLIACKACEGRFITNDGISSDGKNIYVKRPSWCPLVELPEKHGRLIDADALIKFVEDRYEITWESDCYEGGIKDACSDILEKIDTMPTVIEAEDGE